MSICWEYLEPRMRMNEGMNVLWCDCSFTCAYMGGCIARLHSDNIRNSPISGSTASVAWSMRTCVIVVAARWL